MMSSVAARRPVTDYLPCDVCGGQDESCDTDCAREVNVICADCVESREINDARMSRYDVAWESGKADR